MKFRCSTGGFSLIEVLCAILLLGVGMVALTQGLVAALHSSKESEIQTTAAIIAAGRIETLRAEGFLTPGVERGEQADVLALYQWEQTIVPTDIDGLHEVTVAVQRGRNGKPIFELKTLLFEPPYSPTSSQEDSDTGAGQDRRRDRRRR